MCVSAGIVAPRTQSSLRLKHLAREQDERLADLYEEQGRNEEAKEFRREAAAIEPTLEVHSDGSVLRKKSTITFGNEGLPLSELSNVAARLRAASSQPVIARPKVGRNEPCPCGSGKKFKKCCGG